MAISSDKRGLYPGLAAGLRQADPRLKLALAWLTVVWPGFLPAGLLPLLAAASCLVTAIGLRISPRLSPLVKAGFRFWLFWMLAKAGLDWLGPGFSGPALAVFGLKLAIYLNAGFSLCLSCTPLELAWAGGWFLAPPLGSRRAGRLALGVAMMPHLAILMLDGAQKVKLALAQRAAEVSWLKRNILFVGAVVRSWQAQIPGLALALASRWPDLDRSVFGRNHYSGDRFLNS